MFIFEKLVMKRAGLFLAILIICFVSVLSVYSQNRNFEVIGNIPQAGETEVSLKSVVEVKFNKNIKTRSVNSFTVTLNDGRSDVSGSVQLNFSKKSIIFTPYEELIPDRLYTFKVDKNIEDIDGIKISKDHVFTFRTISVDVIRPSVLSVFPLSGSLDADINENIEIQVSEMLKLTSVNTRSIKVVEENSPISGKLKFVKESNKIIFYPETSLKYNKKYEVFVSKTVQDLAGNTLPGDIRWSFYTRREPDTQAPRVVSIFPADNSENIPVNVKIGIVYDESLKPEDVNSFSFILKNSRSNVACSVEFQESINTVYLIPLQALSYKEGYQVKIYPGIRDRYDNATDREFVFNFKTIEAPDEIPPSVVSFYPEDLEEGVSLEVKPRAYFNESLRDMTVNPLSVILYCGYRKVNGKVFYNNSEKYIEFIPEKKLEHDKKYLFVIKRDVSDNAGNSLMSEQVISFNTKLPPDRYGPLVVFSSPTVGEKGVLTDKEITVFFNEPVNPSTCNRKNLSVYDKKNKKILYGKVSYEPSDNRAIIKLDRIFDFNSVYEVSVKNVKDLNGNKMIKDVKWEFTTISAPDKIPPEIITSHPVDGAHAVDVFSQFYGIFSEPLNPASVNSYSVLLNDGKNDVPAQISYDRIYNKIIIIPQDRLDFERMYFLIFQTSLSDMSGNRIKKPIILKFMTDKKPDVIPPEVISVQPDASKSGVDVTSNIVVEFSEEIDEATLNNYTFQVRRSSDKKEIKGKILYDSLYLRGVFIPEKRFEFGTLYEVKVKKGILDRESNPMRNDCSWEFLTIHEEKLKHMGIGEAYTWIEEDPFPDLKRDHWAFNIIKELKRKGYLEDYPIERFNGERAISRMEFALMVEKMIRSLEMREQMDEYDRMLIEKLLLNFSGEIKVLGGNLSELKIVLEKRKELLYKQEERADRLENRVDVFKRTVFNRIRRKKMTALMMMALLAAF